jgi:hypothetical protein
MQKNHPGHLHTLCKAHRLSCKGGKPSNQGNLDAVQAKVLEAWWLLWLQVVEAMV